MVLNFLKSGYKKVHNAFVKTGSLLGDKLRSLFKGDIDEEKLEKLEKLFYEADLGWQTASDLTAKVRALHASGAKLDADAILVNVRQDLTAILSAHSTEMRAIPKEKQPMVILIIGVNGNGKTTTVAKLAKYYQNANKKVLIGAADTFRAAAMEQLETWANRIGVDVVKGHSKSDPAAVVFDAITAAKARQADVVIIDTAGRLHTKTNLMQELEKIGRICSKIHVGSPHEILLILDATTGQNAIDQAKTFNKYVPITGLVLTKLDGSAKGGVVVAISREIKIPVKFIGVGEGIDDLEPFQPEQFVKMLFE